MTVSNLINASSYDEIRSLVDLELFKTPDKMPDSLIRQASFSGAAINDVLEDVSDAESKTDGDLVRVQNAAKYYCAARLAEIYRPTTSINVSARDASYAQPRFNGERRAGELRALAAQEIAQVVDSSTADTAAMPSMFIAAPGTRGKL